MGNLCSVQNDADDLQVLVAILVDGAFAAKTHWKTTLASLHTIAKEHARTSPQGHLLVGVCCDSFLGKLKRFVDAEASSFDEANLALTGFTPANRPTPLYDAMLSFYALVEETLARLDGSTWKVRIMIMTNGEDHTSTTSLHAIRFITETKKMYGWEITYINGNASEHVLRGEPRV